MAFTSREAPFTALSNSTKLSFALTRRARSPTLATSMTLLLALVLMAPPSTPLPPSSAPSPLIVTFEVPQYVEAPNAPVMNVVITNDTDASLPIVTFDSAVCFAWFQLEMEVKHPGGKALHVNECAVLSFPGVQATLEPHGQMKKVISFAELFPQEKWHGRYDLRIDWNPTRLRTLAAGQPSPTAKQTSLSVQQLAVLKPLGHFEVKKGAVVPLPGGGRFAFESHSHKRTEPGDESPLVIYGKTASGTEALKPFYKNVFVSESRFFSIEPKLLFRLDDYVYGESMKLTYFGASAIDE